MDDANAEPVSVLLINGERLEAEHVLRPLRKELYQQADTLSANAYRSQLRDKIIAEFREQARNTLLYQEASKRLSEREKEAFEGFVDDEIRQQVNSKYGGRQTRYEKALIDQGLTVADDRGRIRRQLVTLRFLHQTVMPRVVDPTRAELRRFYEEQKDKLTQPERRKMSLIEIPIGEADSFRAGSRGSTVAGASTGSSEANSRSAAADLIAKAKAELDSGADFASVARKYSRGVNAEAGGAWDFLTRGSVRERWERPVEALFSMSQGQVSPVIETGEAFFIVRSEEIDAAVVPDFETMQPKLVEAYRDHQFNLLVDERVRELQEAAVFIPRNVGRFLEGVAQAAPESKRP